MANCNRTTIEFQHALGTDRLYMYVYDPTNAILRERVWLVSARMCALQEYYYLVGVSVRT